MGSTSRHIMPLAINSFRGRHTHSHKHTHKHTYTYWWSAQDQFLKTRHVPACGWHMPGLKTTHTYARTNTHVHTHKQMLKHAQTYTHTHCIPTRYWVMFNYFEPMIHICLCLSFCVCVCVHLTARTALPKQTCMALYYSMKIPSLFLSMLWW